MPTSERLISRPAALAADRAKLRNTAVPYSASSGEHVRAGTQLLGLGIVMGLEGYGGVRPLVTPRGLGGPDDVAGAVIGSLGLGLDREWELVGARQTGLGLSLRDLLGVRGRTPAEAEAEPDD